MCRCGHHPAAFNASPSLNQLTTHELMDQLGKWGYKSCDIRDEGTGRITITTETTLTRHEQETLEASMPAGVSLMFATKVKTKMEVPEVLRKWAKDTAKELKKL